MVDEVTGRELSTSIEANTDVTGFEHSGDRQEALRDSIKESMRVHGWEGPREQEEEREIERSSRERRASVQRERRVEYDEPPARGYTTDDGIAAPEWWNKSAQKGWKNTPKAVKDEVVGFYNRAIDAAQEIDAHYGEINQAIAPYREIIRAFNKTDGEAVAQLFSWFQALADNPHNAFPALLNSYNYDIRNLIERYYPGIIAEYQWLKNTLRQVVGDKAFRQAWHNASFIYKQNQGRQNQQAYNQQLAQQQYQQAVQRQAYEMAYPVLEEQAQRKQWETQSYLDQWARNKPYYERVRYQMGVLLTPDPQTGIAAVPLKNGLVDLDKAYEVACYMDEEVRNHMARTQQRSVQRARRAASSIAPQGPPSRSMNAQKMPGATGKSVRESLYESIDQLR